MGLPDAENHIKPVEIQSFAGAHPLTISAGPQPVGAPGETLSTLENLSAGQQLDY